MRSVGVEGWKGVGSLRAEFKNRGTNADAADRADAGATATAYLLGKDFSRGGAEGTRRRGGRLSGSSCSHSLIRPLHPQPHMTLMDRRERFLSPAQAGSCCRCVALASAQSAASASGPPFLNSERRLSTPLATPSSVSPPRCADRRDGARGVTGAPSTRHPPPTRGAAPARTSSPHPARSSRGGRPPCRARGRG